MILVLGRGRSRSWGRREEAGTGGGGGEYRTGLAPRFSRSDGDSVDWLENPLGREDDSRTNDGLAQFVLREGMVAEAMPTNAAGRAGWLGREDSNLRMAAPKAAALPLGDSPTTVPETGKPETRRGHSHLVSGPELSHEARRIGVPGSIEPCGRACFEVVANGKTVLANREGLI